jgi:signal transduction histidine kinase
MRISLSKERNTEQGIKPVVEEDRLEKTLAISASILSSMDIDIIIRKVVDSVTDEFGFEACDVFILDEEHDNFAVRATKGYPQPLSERISGLALSRQSVERNLDESKKLGKFTYIYKADPETAAADYYGILHPERVGDKRVHPDDWHELDVLYVLFEDGDGQVLGFMEPDGPRSRKVPGPQLVKNLETFAELVSIAVTNAKLVGALNRTVKLFRALLDTTVAMQTPSDLPDTLKTIGEKLNQLVPFDEVSVYLVDWNKNLLKPIYAQGPCSDEVMSDTGPISGLAGDVARTGKITIVEDSVEDPRVEDIPGLEDLEVRQTIMAIPLKGKSGTVEGVLELYRDKNRKFTDAECAVAEPFASHAAMALENAKLRDEQAQNLEIAQKSYEEMKDLDRMKDSLVDTISHELRTPLTMLLGYLEMLSSGMYGDVTPKMNEKFNNMLEQVKRINVLVATMLEMSRLQNKTLKLDFGKINLAMVTREILSEIEPDIKEKRHTVSVLFGNDLPIVEADRLRMHDVIENMISNAIKYTDPGGKIVIGADILEGRVHIWVKDNGVGISDEEQPKLFDRFFLADAGLTRGDNRVGIGLYTSREVVKRHGGEMWFESKKGVGSTFHMAVPFKQK